MDTDLPELLDLRVLIRIKLIRQMLLDIWAQCISEFSLAIVIPGKTNQREEHWGLQDRFIGIEIILGHRWRAVLSADYRGEV